MDYNNDSTIKQLSRASGLGFKKLEHLRRARVQMLQQFVGRFYEPDGSSSEDSRRAYPMNMMYQAVTTLVPNLVYKDPRTKISSRFLPYEQYAQLLELAVNHLGEEIGLRRTLRMAIVDSMFLAGFVKTGIGISGQTLAIEGVEHDLGQPYADRVDPDDMTIDPLARDLEEATFLGNKIRVAKEVLLETGMYDEDRLKKLESRYSNPNRKAAEFMSSGSSLPLAEANELKEYYDLVEMWLPQDQVIVTIPWVEDGTVTADDVLRVVDYEGPERGPYHMLGYAFAPNNPMPVAPAGIWYDLHMMVNRIARKIARQAERQKSVLAYEGDAWEDAAEIVDADDGESVRVDSINSIKEVSYGGASDDGYQFMDWSKQLFSEMAMNVDMLSGTGSDEPTATQAQMVEGNANLRIADMQSMVYEFCGDIMKDLAFYLHNDPLIELPLVKRVMGQDVQTFYTPEMREGDWIDYNIKIVPYSMARQDPNTKVRRVMELAANVIPALAQAYMMLGPAFQLENALLMVCRNMGLEDEMDELINSQVLAMANQQMMMLMEMGVPLDQKVIKSLMNPMMMQTAPVGGQQAAMMGMAANGGGPMQPNQPNPNQMMEGGMGGKEEANRNRQEAGNEFQRTM